jgi:glyoxylase-like metal-dependent hydrolase (beta-lactamase superfamily II)
MAIPTYEIYALKYAGPFTRPASLVRWYQDFDQSAQVNYYLFAIRGGRETILVDAGCSLRWAREKSLANYVNPVQVLKRIEIDARQVRHLVLTHIHFDHVGGITLFPKAMIYVQEKEFNFWMKDPIAKRAPFLLLTDPPANRYPGRQKDPAGHRAAALPGTYPWLADDSGEYREGQSHRGFGCRSCLLGLSNRHPERPHHRHDCLDEEL